MTDKKNKKQAPPQSKPNDYFRGEPREVLRSAIKTASYNPRTISDEAKKSLKRGIKKYGVVGGIVVNEGTGMTVVGGHQRIAVLDELNKYPEKDYTLRVEVINVPEKEERTLNILLNNPHAQGEWDYDALREMIPDIDYQEAGLTDEDLNIIGIDFTVQTDGEQGIADALSDLRQPIEDERTAKRELNEAERQAKIDDIKRKKSGVMDKAVSEVEADEAYVMLSFSTYKAKKAFMARFGYNTDDKFIKGEVFSEQIERVE